MLIPGHEDKYLVLPRTFHSQGFLVPKDGQHADKDDVRDHGDGHDHDCDLPWE